MTTKRSVWKYPLDLVDEPQPVYMPHGAKVVHVDVQGVALCVWAEVVPGRSESERWFVVEGTGHPIKNEGRHVGTALMHGGGLVWHVYEVGEGSDG